MSVLLKSSFSVLLMCILYMLNCLFLALCPRRQQELSNLITDKKFLEAIGLAITLEQPFRVMNIMKGTVNSQMQSTAVLRRYLYCVHLYEQTPLFKGWFPLAYKHKHKLIYADAVRC